LPGSRSNDNQSKPNAKLFEIKRSNVNLNMNNNYYANNSRINNASPKPTNPTLNIEVPLYMRGKSKIGGGVTIPYQPSAQ